MPRRRFTPEQREAILKGREIRHRACARGNHWWYPDFKHESIDLVEPQYRTLKQRFPMPLWDNETIVCTAHKCGKHGKMVDLTEKKQKKMRDIFEGFVENTKSMRKG